MVEEQDKAELKVDVPTPSDDEAQVGEAVENLLAAYQNTAEWIRFADAKATVVLTVAGALASLLIPTVHEFLNRDEHLTSWWTILGMALFLGWLFFMGSSTVWAFLCVQPFRRKGRHPALDSCKHFHSASISQHYSIDEIDKFIADCNQMGMAGFKNEVLAGMLIDAHISNTKYNRVSRSIKLLAISAVFALLYTLAIQF